MQKGQRDPCNPRTVTGIYSRLPLLRQLKGFDTARLCFPHPRILNFLHTVLVGTGTSRKIRADKIEQKLGGVGVHVQWITDAGEVGLNLFYRAKVTGSSCRQKQQRIEKLEGAGRRLMDTRDDDELHWSAGPKRT